MVGSISIIEWRNARYRNHIHRFDAAHVQVVLNPGRIAQTQRSRGTHNEWAGVRFGIRKTGYCNLPIPKWLPNRMRVWNKNLKGL